MAQSKTPNRLRANGADDAQSASQCFRFINPHRLFHGVWLPQWLEERPEVSERAKKLYAYLTYFAGGKGYAWPSFNHLAEKLHISRRYVIELVKELSAHGLIMATRVNNPARGHCTNYYRFLWHPWMQTADDGDFRLAVREGQAPFQTAESDPSSTSPSEPQVTTPGEQEFTSPSELEDTSPGEPQITPLVIPSSPQENNKKRINNRGKVTATSSSSSPSKQIRRLHRPQRSCRTQRKSSSNAALPNYERKSPWLSGRVFTTGQSNSMRKAPSQARLHPRRPTAEVEGF